jgi:hypothetical protein
MSLRTTATNSRVRTGFDFDDGQVALGLSRQDIIRHSCRGRQREGQSRSCGRATDGCAQINFGAAITPVDSLRYSQSISTQ